MKATPQHEVDRLRTLSTQLAENPIWTEALADLEADAMARWLASRHTAEREQVFYEVQALRALSARLESYKRAGKLR